METWLWNYGSYASGITYYAGCYRFIVGLEKCLEMFCKERNALNMLDDTHNAQSKYKCVCLLQPPQGCREMLNSSNVMSLQVGLEITRGSRAESQPLVCSELWSYVMENSNHLLTNGFGSYLWYLPCLCVRGIAKVNVHLQSTMLHSGADVTGLILLSIFSQLYICNNSY